MSITRLRARLIPFRAHSRRPIRGIPARWSISSVPRVRSKVSGTSRKSTPLRSHKPTISMIRGCSAEGRAITTSSMACACKTRGQVARRAQALEAPERGPLRPEHVVAEADQGVPQAGAPRHLLHHHLPDVPRPYHQHPGHPDPSLPAPGGHPPPHQAGQGQEDDDQQPGVEQHGPGGDPGPEDVEDHHQHGHRHRHPGGDRLHLVQPLRRALELVQPPAGEDGQGHHHQDRFGQVVGRERGVEELPRVRRDQAHLVAQPEGGDEAQVDQQGVGEEGRQARPQPAAGPLRPARLRRRGGRRLSRPVPVASHPQRRQGRRRPCRRAASCQAGRHGVAPAAR